MKKNVITIIMLLLVCSMVYGCQSQSNNKAASEGSNKIENICGISVDKVKKISVMNGTNGNSSDILDASQIKKAIDTLSQLEVTYVKEKENIEGFLYGITIETETKTINITILSETSAWIDDKEYEIKSSISDVKNLFSELE